MTPWWGYLLIVTCSCVLLLIVVDVFVRPPGLIRYWWHLRQERRAGRR